MIPKSEDLPAYNAQKNLSGSERVHGYTLIDRIICCTRFVVQHFLLHYKMGVMRAPTLTMVKYARIDVYS